MEVCGREHLLKNDIFTEIENLTSNDCSKSILDGLKSVSKSIYDHLYKDNSLTELKSKSFRKLLIDGFDAEQIFQQIELQNKSALAHFNVHLNDIEDSKYVQHEAPFEDSDVSDSDNELAQKYAKTDFSNRKEEYIFDDDSDASVSDSDLAKLKLSAQNNLSDDDEEDKFDDNIESEDENDTLSPVKSSKTKKVRFQDQSQKSKYRSVVDDQFFKLSNLEEFLKVEDLRVENNLDELDRDDDIDYFQDIPSDDDPDSGDELEDEDFEKPKDIMYDDFFDAPESGDEGDKDEKAFDKEPGDTNNLVNDEDDYDMEEGDEEENEIGKTGKDQQVSTPGKDTLKTPFELEQEKIKQTICSYEESLIQKPEWHLTGEVDASKRPKDSLLEQETQFDVNAKIAPVNSEIFEDQVDQSIISIIKNKAFSDGQRTYKPEHDLNYKKEILLEQTKSKKSLAEVYEEQYLKKKYGEQEKEEDPRHVEITKSINSLLPNLQALFSHIPKPAIPDIKIVSNLPAITVEEVAPTSISDVTLLAPEEIKKKSGVIKGQTERSDTDRKRERRKKKMFQKMKYKKMQSETEGDKPLTSKARKLDKINTLKKLKQNRNTKIAEMGDEKIKSSKDFFSRLQETVNSKVQPSQAKKRKK